MMLDTVSFITRMGEVSKAKGSHDMRQPTLEERVAASKEAVTQILGQSVRVPTKKDWRSMLGMFTHDAVMKDIDAEGRKIRQADRAQAKS
jgi:hypothetical protein